MIYAGGAVAPPVLSPPSPALCQAQALQCQSQFIAIQ